MKEGDLWYFPVGLPHSLQGLEPGGAEFVLAFDNGISIRWHRMPEEAAHRAGLKVGQRPSWRSSNEHPVAASRRLALRHWPRPVAGCRCFRPRSMRSSHSIARRRVQRSGHRHLGHEPLPLYRVIMRQSLLWSDYETHKGASGDRAALRRVRSEVHGAMEFSSTSTTRRHTRTTPSAPYGVRMENNPPVTHDGPRASRTSSRVLRNSCRASGSFAASLP